WAPWTEPKKRLRAAAMESKRRGGAEGAGERQRREGAAEAALHDRLASSHRWEEAAAPVWAGHQTEPEAAAHPSRASTVPGEARLQPSDQGVTRPSIGWFARTRSCTPAAARTA